MGELVRIRGVSKFFGRAAAVADVTLTVTAGPAVGLVGPNGAGKTTLFALIGGLMRPSGGTLAVMGRPPGHPDLCGRLSLLPQDVPLQRGVPLHRQLALLAGLHGRRPWKAARDEAEQVLALLGLAELSARVPETLSAGQRKRAIIAQALIGDPVLVLLDEPTAGLDPAGVARVREAIATLGRERTFLVSSHNLEEVEDLCERVALMDRGRLVAYEPLAELVDRSGYVGVRLDREPSGEVAEALRRLPGVLELEQGAGEPRRLIVKFRDVPPDKMQMRILQALGDSGLEVLEISRGRGLRERVLELTAPRPR